MAIFDEQVLEPFVARGIGNSGVASRQIQAGNLPDLSAAVRQSAVTQQNLSDQQSATMKALQIKNFQPSGGGGRGVSIRNSAPVGAVVQQDKNGAYVLSYGGSNVSGQGATKQTFNSINDLKSFVSSNPYLKNAGVALQGGAHLTPEAMSSGFQIADPAVFNVLYNNAVYGTQQQKGSFKDLKFSPNESQKADIQKGNQTVLDERKLSLRNAAATIEDPIKRGAAQRALGLRF